MLEIWYSQVYALIPSNKIRIWGKPPMQRCTTCFVRIDVSKSTIASITILTPEYIEEKFGKFGKPTIKHQLLISLKARAAIYDSKDKILSFLDSKKLSYHIKHDYEPQSREWFKNLISKNCISFHY